MSKNSDPSSTPFVSSSYLTAPFDLAGLLLAGGGWIRARIDDVVATRRTTRIPLEQAVPIYTVYMTAYAAPDGEVHYFDDPYSLDGAVSRLLDDRAGD